MKTSIIVTAAVILLLVSCKDSKPVQEEAAAVQQVDPVNTSGLEAMPFDELKFLFNNATYVDYIFHTLPFSVSQDTPGGVQANIAMISVGPPVNYKEGCVSLGREFFHVDGIIVWEADVYFDPVNRCSAYIFFKDGKAQYANAISDAGLTFYNNLVKQAFNPANGIQRSSN